MASQFKIWLSDINILIYILVIIFNISSWIDLNSIWVELPLMVNRLPEGWDLPSYFIIIINCSKIGLIVYVIAKKLLKDKLQEWPIVFFIIGTGGACLLAVGFMWDETMVVNGAEHSVSLLGFTAALSFGDCMTAVVFLPYMDRYQSQYISAFFVGEGMCQIIPAIASMLQGVGETPICENQTVLVLNDTSGVNTTQYQITASFPPPRFSVRAFFIFMFCLMICSGVAFSLLHFVPYLKKEQMKQVPHTQTKNVDQEDYSVCENEGTVEMTYVIRELEQMQKLNQMQHASHMEDQVKERMSKVEFLYFFVQCVWMFGVMYGINPAIQPYACLPYGNRAYNLAVRIGLAMNPIVSFLALLISTRSKVKIGMMTLLGAICFAYVMVLSSLSPYPPLKKSETGEALVILAFVLIMALYNFNRSCISYVFKENAGADGLMWLGVAMHVGTFLGSIVGFILTTALHLFESEPPCPGM